jgi:hypothetical protein
VVILAIASRAGADPEPRTIDSKPFRDHLEVLRDDRGGIYVVLRDGDSQRAWYGTGKALYEQVIIGSSSDGSTGSWELNIYAPRVSGIRPATLGRGADGSYSRYCSPDHDETSQLKLTLVPADQAKHVLERSTLMTSALIRRPRLLARDETGVYYYVDELRQMYGEGGQRLFVGKKGAMQKLALTDIATDTAGEIYSTKAGDLRMTLPDQDASGSASSKPTIVWVQGDKRTPLVLLDFDLNKPLIYRSLGVYTFVGTVCDDI